MTCNPLVASSVVMSTLIPPAGCVVISFAEKALYKWRVDAVRVVFLTDYFDQEL